MMSEKELKNIICCPYAFLPDMNTGVNIVKRESQISIYLKNACVALVSAKRFNPEDTVALVTNLDIAQIPLKFRRVLKNRQIEIVTVPFDQFRPENSCLWALAFYKLCVLRYLSKGAYKNICYLDTDVIVQYSFDAIWEECRDHILLYDIMHGRNTADYVQLCEEVKRFTGQNSYPIHWGGEFYASSAANAKRYTDVLMQVFEKIKRDRFVTRFGDEFVICIAAIPLKGMIKNAAAYITRYWTSGGFRLVTTNFENNFVCILHLPNEKERGLCLIFEQYIRKGIFPTHQKIWNICRLSTVPPIDKLKIWIRRKEHSKELDNWNQKM